MRFFSRTKAAPPEFVPMVMPEPVDPSVPRKKILVVEDDPVVAKTLSMTLNARGYQVVCAANSCDAIKLVQEQDPDMLLVDVGLPPDVGGALADGFQVTEWLQRTHSRKIPSIIISGANKPAYKLRAASIGAEAFLAKPIDNKALVDSIESALQHPVPVKEGTIHLKMASGSVEES